MSPDTDINFVGTPADPLPKTKGRPKGSKNKTKAPPLRAEGLEGDDPIQISPSVAWVIGEPDPDGSATIHGDTEWVLARSEVTVRLQSHEVPEGLEMVLQKHVIVGLSALPNGNASIITNIGTDQPLILVTAEPYVDVKKRLYPGLEQSA